MSTNDDEQFARTIPDGELSDAEQADLQHTAPEIEPGYEPTVAAEPSALEEKIRAKMRQQPRIRKDPLLGRIFGERFEITAKIGTGGMGVVYKARQRGMDRHVAIKVLLKEYLTNETAVRRFQREALAVSKLEHPNTVRIYDFGETEDKILYIAMEFLPGAPLSRLLSQQRQLPVRQVLRVVTQVCRSLDEAHRKGIVHRDLKPDNVFVGTIEGQKDFVKVLDFGVAKLREGGDEGGTLTQHGVIFGTPKYMSPEQCKSQVVDARSDLYAVGVMMYEMLAGRVPFEADNSMAILVAHAQDTPSSLSSVRPDLVVPFEVEELLHALLSKEPIDRPQTAKDVIEACERLLDAIPSDFERVITYESDEAAALRIDRSQAYTVPEDPLSRTEQRRLFLPDNQGGDTVAIDAPAIPTPLWKKVALVAALLLVATGGAAAWAYGQIAALPSSVRQVIPDKLPSGELPALPSELVTITASANVDNVTLVDPATDRVLGTLPKKGQGKSFRWLKEPGRTVAIELRHGSAKPVARTIDLSADGTLEPAEFVVDEVVEVVVAPPEPETVELTVVSNVDQALITLSDRDAAYPLAAGALQKQLSLEKGEQEVTVTVSRAGYISAKATFVPSKAGTVKLTLEKDPNAAPIVAPKVAITLELNVGTVGVKLPNGLKFETPKKSSEPLVLMLEQGSAPVELALSRRGYEDQTVKVVPDAAKSVSAKLVRKKGAKKPVVSGKPAGKSPTGNTPETPKNPKLNPIKKPKPTGPGRLGRMKGIK